MTDADAKDLTTVLCNLHDRLADLNAAISALPAKIAEALTKPQEVDGRILPLIPSVAPPAATAHKQVPWPNRLRVWLARRACSASVAVKSTTAAAMCGQVPL